jgi:hypothetical protein
MYGVTAKVTEEISMLFKHQRFNSGSSQQIAKHHPGGASANNTASHFAAGLHGVPFLSGINALRQQQTLTGRNRNYKVHTIEAAAASQ